MWGGGIYQPSDDLTGGYDFYSVCDELGIFSWSELIFSDALYPINDFLLETVEPEVRQNIRRVNRHPSNAQWAGGNEIEGIVLGVNASFENGTHYLNEVCQSVKQIYRVVRRMTLYPYSTRPSSESFCMISSCRRSLR